MCYTFGNCVGQLVAGAGFLTTQQNIHLSET